MTACAKSAKPWAINIAGPAAGEDQTSLVFDPTSPCGAEVNVVGSQRVPLQVVDSFGGCIDGCPGDLVLVRGHVQMLERAEGPGLVSPRVIGPCQGLTAAPRVKLKISACGWRGPVIIDSDSMVVMPAGELQVEVLAPGPNTGGIGWSTESQELADETAWEHVNIAVTVCPCTCGWVPEGFLTEWVNMLNNADRRELIKPRRAVQLAMNAADAATGASVAAVAWLKAQEATGVTGNKGSLSAGLSNIGAFPIIELASLGTHNYGLRWTIR